MRSVTSLLLLITLLLGAVSAVKHHDIKHAHHEVLKTVHSTLASLHKVHGLHTGLFHVGKNTTAAPHHKHTFGAHQSPAATPAAPRGSCDQDGFSAAQVTVLQACPSLSGLVSGTVTPQEFLPGFCGSNCFNVIARELPRFSACLDGTTAFLASWVVTCQVTPRCFSEGYIRGGISVQSQCGSMNALTQFSNFTTAAMNDVTTACTNGCITRSLDLASTYPECVTGSDGARIDVTALRALYGHLCTTYNGQYCAWNLRSLGRIDCDSNCYSSSSYCDNSCSLALNNDRLNAMCTPCLAGVVRFVGAVGQDAVAVANSVEFMCGRAVPGDNTTSYCYIAAGQQISAATSYLATNTSQASACSGAAGRCLPRYFALGASLAAYSAGATFKACIRYGYYSSASCLRNYESSLRSAESSRVIGDIVCAQNAANSYCMPYFYAVAGSSCPYYAALGTSCPSSCATEGSAIVTNAGCCLPLINNFLRMSSTTYPAQYLPSQGGVTLSYTGANYSYSFTSSYSRGSIDRSQQPLNYLAVCGTNSSDLWSAIESGCPASANAVNRSLAVNLAWSRVNANPAFKAQLRASLRGDTAAALGVAPSTIKNDDVVENSAAIVQVRGASSRRQSTSSGCRYAFSIDSANAAAAAASFDAAVTAGTLTTPSTATTTAAGCPSCLDARATSAVQVNAPPPGVSGGGGGGSSSPANAFSVAVAALIAVVLALVL